MNVNFLLCVLLTYVNAIKIQKSSSDESDNKDVGCKEDSSSYQPSRPLKVRYGLLDIECIQSLFQHFVEENNKSYSCHSEEERRKKIFNENLRRYDRMNKAERGTAVYGINKFSDLSAQEFKDKIMTVRIERSDPQNCDSTYDESALNFDFPDNFDWRKQGAVTPMKDQRSCGACWAFATVANLESLYYMKYKELKEFSVQQLIDCDDESSGCRGGDPLQGYTYVFYWSKFGGLQTGEKYPYVEKKRDCKEEQGSGVLRVSQVVELPPNETIIAAHIYKNGPVTATLDASMMDGYKGGIAHPPDYACSKKKANYAVQLVGYGEKVEELNGHKEYVPFWIARNSYGDDAFDKGYYYLYRGDNTCGIKNHVTSAVLADCSKE